MRKATISIFIIISISELHRRLQRGVSSCMNTFNIMSLKQQLCDGAMGKWGPCILGPQVPTFIGK